jgi:DNA gyrase subunit B
MTDVTIKALDQHQHLLKRLSLIFGSVEGPGIEYSSQKGVALREILDNGLDEIRAGYGEWLKLSFYKDGSFESYDSGRGIPVSPGKDAEGRPASQLYLALGVLQSGGKFETDSKRFSSGLNGLGGSASIHVSKMAVVKVYRDKKEYELHFKDGSPGFFADALDPDSKFTPLKKLTELRESKDTRSVAERKNYPTGTRIRLWLRDEVFSSSNPYDDQDIIARLRSTSFLVPRLHAEVYNELHEVDGKPQEEYYNFPNGVEDLIELSRPDAKLTELIHIKAEGVYTEKNVAVLQNNGSVTNQDLQRSVPIELALQWGDKYEETVQTFVNTIHTKLDGVHKTAFQKAMVEAFGEKFASVRGLMKKGEVDELMVDDFMEGLTAIVSVQVAEPVFTSQSKEALSGREVQKAINEVLVRELKQWIASSKNAKQLDLIGAKVVTAAKNRQKAKEAKEINRKKNEISQSSLPVKLVDCELSGSEEAELYICEGNSASTSLKAARDGRIHALLPIRGKIISAHKTTMKSVLANNEVQDIIKALGADSGKDFDINKMRYGRVFIAADADPDGLAIACLIYAIFWHLFKPVIEEGRLYKLETPLFVISTSQGSKSRKIYARDEIHRDREVKVLKKNGIKHSITRLKGLGEVDADVLSETALNSETRIITQITMDSVEQTLNSLDIILAPDTGPRKLWLEAAEIDEETLDL